MTTVTSDEIIKLLQDSKDKVVSQNVAALLNKLEEFILINTDDIKKYEASITRFCDYYDFNMHKEELINYFEKNYQGDNLYENLNSFMIYCMFKNISELLEIYQLDLDRKETKSLEECLTVSLIDVDYLIDIFQENKEKETSNKVDMSFIDENKYGIYFAGTAYKDIKSLPKFALKSLINKLKGDLSTQDTVPHAEIVENIKETCDVPLLRIQFSDDYRVAFIRTKGTTLIIGTELKSGKNSNYTRYAHTAKKIDEVYKELDDYINGKKSENTVHYKTTKFIERFLKKEKERSIEVRP